MDAEKFDKVVLDLLYDELDELTRASAIRHMEQSGKAKALYSELRATREVGAVPLVEPPGDLEERILAAEERARAGRPLPQRLGTLVSIVASYAMRPQLGMAAVLLLMVGSSLLLLRVKPGEPSSVQVTERGVPESDKETTAALPTKNAPVPTRGDDTAQRGAASRTRAAEPARAEPVTEERLAEKEEPAPFPGGAEALAMHAAKRSSGPVDRGALDEGLGLYGRDDVAPPSAAAPAAGAGAALAESTALDGRGSASEPEKARDDCVVTLPRYETALSRAASQIERNRARWGAAECYARLGRVESARKTYTALLTAPAYADRARAALAALPEPAATSAPAVAQAAPPPPEAKAAKPAAPQPAASAAPNTSATTEH